MINSLKMYTRPLNQLAVPLLANSIFGLSIELIDQAMVGHLSVSAYASVGAVANFLYTAGGILGALAITLNIEGSKAMGEQRPDKYLTALSSSFLLDLIIGSGFGAACFAFREPFLRSIFSFSGPALRDGSSYLSIMSGYMLLQLIIFTCTNVLKIKKKTKWILIVSTITTLLHTCLNYLLIFGAFEFPKLGVSGAAWSGIVTLCLDAGAYAFILKKDIKSALNTRPADAVLMLRKSLALMGQELLEGSVFVVALNALLAHLGTLVLSGYLLVSQLLQIGLIPAFMYSSALLTLVSESRGAHQSADLDRFPKAAAILSMILYALMAGLFFLLRAPVIRFITDNSSLIACSSSIFVALWAANIFKPLFDIYKSALQAIGKSSYVLIATCIVHTGALMLIYLLVIVSDLKIYGVFLGLFIDYFIGFVVLSAKYKFKMMRR